MAASTLTELFGAGASYNTTSGVLSVTISNLTTIGGYNGTIATLKPAQILYLILLQARSITEALGTDPTVGLVVQPGYGQIVQRGSASHINKPLTVNVYSLDSTGTVIDPDVLV